MYRDLYRYLVLYRELTVPGVGTFLLEKEPGVIDFPSKTATPSVYSVTFSSKENECGPDFFRQLAALMDKLPAEAVKLFNDFSFDLSGKIKSGAVINWNNVGELSSSVAGNIKFTPAAIVTLREPVDAEKVLRENAGHMVRVGEDERTSGQMTELLTEHTASKNNWWLPAAIVALLAVLFIGWHLSQHGVTSTANMQKGDPVTVPTATYKILQP